MHIRASLQCPQACVHTCQCQCTIFFFAHTVVLCIGSVHIYTCLSKCLHTRPCAGLHTRLHKCLHAAAAESASTAEIIPPTSMHMSVHMSIHMSHACLYAAAAGGAYTAEIIPAIAVPVGEQPPSQPPSALPVIECGCVWTCV